jgi:phage terminase small subunit
MTDDELTVKQTSFIDHLLTDAKGNATEAARRAGYSGTADVLKVTGCQLMQHGGVRAAIAERMGIARAEMEKGGTLLDQVCQLQNKAVEILKRAEGAGDLRTALKAVREVRATIEVVARLTADLPQEKAQQSFVVRFVRPGEVDSGDGKR